MKLLFDESLSPKLVELLRDLFPESECALEGPRRNAIRIAELPRSQDRLIILGR